MLLGTYWTYDEPMRLGWTWGTALITRREAVEEVGTLCEDFFMYGEDVEWCLRMRRHGWEIWFCPEAEVLHHGSQSSARRWQNAERERRVSEGYYRAVALHRGQLYVRVCEPRMLWHVASRGLLPGSKGDRTGLTVGSRKGRTVLETF